MTFKMRELRPGRTFCDLNSVCRVFLCILLVSISIRDVNSEVLTPPYFNLAEGRRITATSTCGEDIYGPELYCKLVGANADTDININLIQGQVCDYCDKDHEGRAHPSQYAIDGSERWWQSPPLSRGMKYNEVNLTIDLGQEFHVAYVLITMANSPRPGVWILERSSDNGGTYKPWQYFADTPADCDKFFGTDSLTPITRDDSVTCDTKYSKVVPLEGGEIVVSLLNQRPSASDFFSSDLLQEWTRATNIRLRFLRAKTLLGHLMSVARQDPTVTRRYFYSIKDISIGGRCRCNGHADLCDITDPEDAYKLLCRCQHNTCGSQCEKCCPGFVQKAWRPATYGQPFVCERCNCYGHSIECYYDEEVDQNRTSIDALGDYEGGGVCINCRDSTEGINCNKCKPTYYRPHGRALDDVNVCEPCRCDSFFSTGNCEEGTGRCECRKQFLEPNCDACNTGYYDYPDCKQCDCHFNGTREAICEVGGGQCPCNHNFAGKNCDGCAEGYYNFPECLPCECETLGSVSPVCSPEGGQCECENNYGSRRCDQCENGYFKFPTCTYCNCDQRGTREGICDKDSGGCLCREGYGGARCDQCLASFYGYPDCRPCNCSTVGSATTVCDATGKCPCLPNFSGRACDQCTPGYYQYPECLPCNCDSDGSMGVSCDDEGKCQCKLSFDGLRCEDCKEGFYNFPLCEECNCDPAGVIESFSGCGDSPPGELCQCKPRATGRICNECKPLFWNLQQYNPLGCQDCDCHIPGILGGVQVCEGKSGQCPCKPHVVSRQCEECKDGYFNLTAENILGCTDCGCNVGGAGNNICDKSTGQCPCRPRITGLTCTRPLQTHYFPTLYQFQYEAEDGNTPAGGPVRFGYDESIFPDYSWRGYAVYSQLQPETNHDIVVEKSSLYRVVIRYVNPGEQTLIGDIIATPDNANDVEQKYKVRFEPKGQFVTVSTGNVPSPFVLNPGRWHFSIKIDQYLLIDYFTLLPAAYYEGSILQKRVSEPCRINTTGRADAFKGTNIIPDPCIKLEYPNIDKFDSVRGTEGYIEDEGDRIEPSQFYSDRRVIQTLGLDVDQIVLLSPQQRDLNLDLPVSKGGRYALLLEYFTPQGANLTNILVEATSKKGTTKGNAPIYNCKLATLCRQVVTTSEGEVAIFRFDQSQITLAIQAPENSTDRIAIHSITAIPLGKWSLDHIRPKEYCIMKNGSCIVSSYEVPPDSTKVEAEANQPNRVADDDNVPIGVIDKKLVVLDSRDRSIDIVGRVPNPGYYTFLVHYHQPENPDFTLDILVQNGQHYEARVPVVHCPSTAGCRSLVSQDDKNARFYVEDDFVVTLKSPKNVWIDYILAVPSSYDNQKELEKFLEQTPLDETRRFIAECGQNHMFLSKNATGFCRDAVFSLTADYINGALPCECDFGGSKSFECEEFGGQCQCKDHVIGRRCERCRTGYFGFPDCKPCDCPSTALCDPLTGECICPPRVTGEKCDNCASLTYGFDALIGCEECSCSPLGVEGGNLQCDLLTGHCKCRPNVVGRTCDRCFAGYWAFPYCQLCDCDLRGTTIDICNQDTAQCFCKTNVEGRGCDTCKEGSFNLEETNPSGCTKCFCFGKTTRCSSSSLYWTRITAGKTQWTCVAFDPNKNNAVEMGFEIEFEDVGMDDDDDDVDVFVPFYIPEFTVPDGNESNVLYFKADLPRNALASYGGRLSFTVISDPVDSENRESFVGPDVIVEGRELAPSSNVIRLMHFAVDHLDGGHAMRMTLPLMEENFVVLSPTGGMVSATRDQLMIVLKELQAIYIRAGYWRRTREAKMSEFSLEIGSEKFDSPDDRALSIEQCHCPPNYRGHSCEECASGYYRSQLGPFGGFCVPCQCNGHSDVCDPVSGICQDCKHNTTGDHCDQCQEGYHGDASGGTPYDCLICACPLPLISNNFATSCELSQDGLEISCNCREGYVGPRCEGCAPGFYGRPETPGDYCKPCDCSGNIDVNDPQSCDTVTGACLRCMNNTGGPACNLCAQGFYGDALLTKDCQSCNCNVCGTDECDHSTGECQCLDNVIGLNCDRCQPDHYGMTLCDGTGCHYCDCAEASKSTQCDDTTGQCECRKGTTGRRCERCAPGYWNYSPEGCLACECNQEYAVGVGCDPQTGQCSCLPGVVGEKCDRCPYRWVLIEERGCQSCDPCQHQLLDDTDAMAALLDPVKDDFDSVAVSYFTTQKLAYFNETAELLEPDVRLLDPTKVDLDPVYDTVDKLELDGKNFLQKAEVVGDSLKDKAKQSAALRQKSIEVESKVQEAAAKATTAVFETKDLMEGLLAEEKPVSSPQTEAARAEAEAIIETMQNVQFDPKDAIKENESAVQVRNEMKEFVKPITGLNKQLKAESKNIDAIKEKLKDLRNQSDYSILTAEKANEISNQIKESKFPAKLGVLEDRANDMLDNLENATETNILIPEVIDKLEDSYANLDPLLRSVKEMREPLAQNLDTLKNELENNENTIELSQDHARKLKEEADELDSMLGDTRDASENAFAAATAYQDIVNALEEAQRSANQAQHSAENATVMTNGLGEASENAMEPSQNLLILAGAALKQVENDLKIPLEDYKMDIKDIDMMNKKTNTSLNHFDKALDKVSLPSDYSDIEDSIVVSNDATKRAEDARDKMDELLANLTAHSGNVRKLRVTVNDLNKNVEISNNQLNQAKESIPLSAAITGNLEDRTPNIDSKRSEMNGKLSDLKAKIAEAREQANRVPVAMNLIETSSLLVANPQSLESQQAQTKMSVYFKTHEPDGLLVYLGNEPGRKGEDDFMAIEVERGYPVLSIDLGSGPQRIANEKFVADDRWHKATVDRAGKTVRFTISSEDQYGKLHDTPAEDYLTGTKSLLNIDRNSSKLYVGGLPPGQDKPHVKFTSFRGAVDELTIGDEKVGLWNFKDAQNLSPGLERDTTVDVKTEQGLRFQGNGYAILESKLFARKERSAIRFRFLTRAKNGLLFLVGKGKRFMALEVANGSLVLQYDLGGGPTRTVSRYTYNDGIWHVVDAVRDKQDNVLLIDNTDKTYGQSPGRQINLPVSGYMYFGGYPGEHGYAEVTNKDFEGCIEAVSINQATVDLAQAVETRYTVLGCPSSQVDQTVTTFFGSGFVKISVADAPVEGPQVVKTDDSFELNFRFRSNGSNGIIFYGTDQDQMNYLSVSMSSGSLFIKTEPGGNQVRTDTLNDANWHVVTISRGESQLLVNVDDVTEYSYPAPGGPISLNTPGSMYFFGGKPDNYKVRQHALMSQESFTGCLADINLNRKQIDFTDAFVKDASLSQKCITEADKEAEQLISNKSPTIPKWDDTEDDDVVTQRTTTTTKKPEIIYDDRDDNIEIDEVIDEDEDVDFSAEKTTKKPKIEEVLPTPFMECALPYRTNTLETSEMSMDEGIRFGNYDKTSRIEYAVPEDDGSRSAYSIQFKTSRPNGLIFMWTNFDNNDYEVLLMKNGFLHFAFNSGSGPAYLNSSIQFNDTKWHTARVSRHRIQGSLTVDDNILATGNSSGGTTNINAGKTIFIGGLPQAAWSKKLTTNRLLQVNSSFQGCLKNFMMKQRAPQPPQLIHSTEPCTEEVENGFYFYPNQGFLKLHDRFSVGRTIKISLSIRPRHPSGILLSVHGEKDFMILQMVNGSIKFTVDNGKGEMSSSFAKGTYDLCDGRWHSIQVVKSKNIVTLQLDKIFSNPGIGEAGKDATNTKHPLYLGGHPNPAGARGMDTTEQFVGCMKDFTVEQKNFKINHDSIIGKVGLYSCPTN